MDVTATTSSAARVKQSELKEHVQVGFLQHQALNRLNEAQNQQYLQNQARLAQTRMLILSVSCLLASYLWWKLRTNYILTSKYQDLITVVDRQAHNPSSQYRGPDGLSVAWAFDYGTLGGALHGFSNMDLASAIMYAYYDKNTNKAFMGKDQGATALANLWRLSTTTRMNAQQLICQALYSDVDPATVPVQCQMTCNISGVQTAEQIQAEFMGTITMGASSGLALGSMAVPKFGSGASTMAGTAGGLFALGTTAASIYFGYTSANSKIKTQREQCEQSLKGCVNSAHLKCVL